EPLPEQRRGQLVQVASQTHGGGAPGPSHLDLEIRHLLNVHRCHGSRYRGVRTWRVRIVDECSRLESGQVSDGLVGSNPTPSAQGQVAAKPSPTFAASCR